MNKLILVLLFISLIVNSYYCFDNNDKDKNSLSNRNFYFITANKDNSDNGKHLIGGTVGNGYFLKKINTEQGTIEGENIFVSDIISLDSKVNVSIIKELHNNFKGEEQPEMIENKIIVSGEIKSLSSPLIIKNTDGIKGNTLYITDLYHKMENQEDEQVQAIPKPMIKSKEYYYFMKPSSLICNSLVNCSSIVTLKINKGELGHLKSYKENYSKNITLLDTNWLNSRIVTNDPNYNSIVKGYQLGDELIISKVYLNSNDPREKCERMEGASKCVAKQQIATYIRDVNRCPVFEKCVTKSPCHLGIPKCPSGYKPFSISSGSKGCLKHYCDPEFLPNPLNVQ